MCLNKVFRKIYGSKKVEISDQFWKLITITKNVVIYIGLSCYWDA
jgi:hypothetical protein